MEQNLEVSLDIGSTHTTLVVANTSETPENLTTGRRIQILGASRVQNSGMRKGTMVNFEQVASSIHEAVDEVERQTGADIEFVKVCVASPIAYSDNYTETVSVRNNEVRSADLERLISLVKGQHAPDGLDFIHFLSTHFSLDGKTGIQNPVGMWGTDLAAVYHRVLFPQPEIHNIVRACNAAGLRVQNLVSESLAASEAVLDFDEKELGICCISLGASLTHVAVFAAGNPIFSKDYPLGSHHITKDLSVGLRTTQSEAERVKREFGSTVVSHQEARELIDVLGIDGKLTRKISKGEICNIIAPRVIEIFSTIADELKKLKLTSHLSRGLVLTGGGAMLPGICIVAEDCFNIHTRIGHPLLVTGVLEGINHPAGAAAIGTLSSRFSLAHSGKMFAQRAQNGMGISGFARTFWEKVRQPFT